ncbi:MAG: TIGR00266 family protein [Bacteroidetes bacterium]|nr:TIGR00266 family protein [Bacteroidota bacterium]
MNIEINGAPAFGFLHVDLEPGEKLMAESDAMASMNAELDMKAKLNGGLFKGLLKKFLGGESLFINEFANNTQSRLRVTITQPFPGDIRLIELKNGDKLYLQPGAYICSEPGVQLGLKWAGIHSWLGGEGLFRLEISGSGKIAIGAYGGLIDKEVDGELIVDTDHLVAYPPGFSIKTQLSGNLISSFTSGEGIVMRLKGKGKIIIQTRSIGGLTKWINRNL